MWYRCLKVNTPISSWRTSIFSSMTSMVSFSDSRSTNSYGSWAIPPASDEDLPIISRFPSFGHLLWACEWWENPVRNPHSKVTPLSATRNEFGPNRGTWKLHRWRCSEELYNRGYVPLSREALDSIRKQKTFMQAAGAAVGRCFFKKKRFFRKVPQFIMVDTTNCQLVNQGLFSLFILGWY